MKSADIVKEIESVFGKGTWKRTYKKNVKYSRFSDTIVERGFTNKDDGRALRVFEKDEKLGFYTGGPLVAAYTIDADGTSLVFSFEDEEVFNITGKTSVLKYMAFEFFEYEDRGLYIDDHAIIVNGKSVTNIVNKLKKIKYDARILRDYIAEEEPNENITNIISRRFFFDEKPSFCVVSDCIVLSKHMKAKTLYGLYGVDIPSNVKINNNKIRSTSLSIVTALKKAGFGNTTPTKINPVERLNCVYRVFGNSNWEAGETTLSRFETIFGEHINITPYTDKNSGIQVIVYDNGEHVAAWNGKKAGWTLEYMMMSDEVIIVIDDAIACKRATNNTISEYLFLFLPEIVQNSFKDLEFKFSEESRFIAINDHKLFLPVVENSSVMIKMDKLTEVFANDVYGYVRDDIAEDNEWLFSKQMYFTFDKDSFDNGSYFFHNAPKCTEGGCDQHISSLLERLGYKIPSWLEESCENCFESSKPKSETIKILEEIGFIYSENMFK